MRVKVTQQDIDLGLQKDAYSCPIARAVKRQTGAARVKVLFGITVWGEDEVVGLGVSDDARFRWKTASHRLPDEAKSFMLRFDRLGKGGVEPFTFEAEPIERD